jgi:hypothetical protein
MLSLTVLSALPSQFRTHAERRTGVYSRVSHEPVGQGWGMLDILGYRDWFKPLFV